MLSLCLFHLLTSGTHFREYLSLRILAFFISAGM
jgi:hypothetical protein